MPDTSAKGVALTPRFERFIKKMVKTGRYRSQSEVVRDALRQMIEREDERDVVLDELRKQIAAGIAEAERGETIDGPTYMKKWEAEERRASRGSRRKRE